MFEDGAKKQYNLLSTPELNVVHAQITGKRTILEEPYGRKDYARLVLAINAVFVHAEEGVGIMMLTHECLIRMVRAERIRKGE